MLTNKSRFITLLLCVSLSQAGFSQVKAGKDSTVLPLSDTSIVEDNKDNLLDNIPIVSLDENDNQDGSAQNLSVISTNANRDPFLRAASFNFNVVRFRLRGYDADMFSTYMNGVPMETLDNGFTPFGLWGGLNDVIVARNRQNAYSMQAASFGFGSMGGSNYMDTRAFKQFKQTKISYSLSNRNFVHKFAVTKSTGFDKKGWAFSISASRRWAEEGFTDGTYYDGWSFYTGVDKKLSSRQTLSFVAFATPTENGRQGSSVDEIREIAGTNFYNPYWGYQNGKKRNASVAKSFQPFGIITHDWKISPKSTLLTAASYTFGNRSTTALDWYNAPDPRPDYYRYLPSYALDPNEKAATNLAFLENVNLRQINWDGLYNVNYNNVSTIANANGVAGNNVSGRRSLYILEERVIGTKRTNFNTTYNTSVNKHVDIAAGLTYESQRNNYYKKVNDLLGGVFYVDLNQFAERDFQANGTAAQNDLNRPNRILRVGDKFGYDYDINIQKTSAWVQTAVKFHSINFFLAGEHSFTRFWRHGNVKNGLFPNNSFGRSANHDFANYYFKGGITWKFAGSHYLFMNGSYQTRAPFFENSYLAPRTRDFVQDDLKSEKISSIEAGYSLVTPIVKLRATAYYTEFKDQVNVLTFYDDVVRNFVNYALSNIGKKHIGAEIGAEVLVYKGLTLNAAASIGRFRYNTRQNATVTVDNTSEIVSRDLIYSKDFYVPTPQEAYSLGFNYRSPKFWYLNVNVNYFDQMWLDFNPLRRTSEAVAGVAEGSYVWHQIIDQTKLKRQFTVDAFAGYSWLLNKSFKSIKTRSFLVFNFGVTNLLNNKNIVSGGFEQLRFDFQDKNVDKFPAKKFYAYGTTFNASIAYRF
ncbi:MAG: TonB-dependent receptor [Chitinophagaceae bacterium]|nr:TonB-dependent receptor [Chitinophagaceae bacterium]